MDSLIRVTPSLLKEHNKKDDAWSAFNGKVYNITHYLSYHPGGEKELMRVAGRDGTKLFCEYLVMSCARIRLSCCIQHQHTHGSTSTICWTSALWGSWCQRLTRFCDPRFGLGIGTES